MNILLACANGLSTGMLAEKMQDCLDSSGESGRIWAVDVELVEAELVKQPVACVLLGPQVKYMFDEIEETTKRYNVPIKVINSMDYGQMNGEKVLRDALSFIQKQSEK